MEAPCGWRRRHEQGLVIVGGETIAKKEILRLVQPLTGKAEEGHLRRLERLRMDFLYGLPNEQ